jgi:hypothetical protein
MFNKRSAAAFCTLVHVLHVVHVTPCEVSVSVCSRMLAEPRSLEGSCQPTETPSYLWRSDFVLAAVQRVYMRGVQSSELFLQDKKGTHNTQYLTFGWDHKPLPVVGKTGLQLIAEYVEASLGEFALFLGDEWGMHPPGLCANALYVEGCQSKSARTHPTDSAHSAHSQLGRRPESKCLLVSLGPCCLGTKASAVI